MIHGTNDRKMTVFYSNHILLKSKDKWCAAVLGGGCSIQLSYADILTVSIITQIAPECKRFGGKS